VTRCLVSNNALVVLGILVLLAWPCRALAGDCPIFIVGGWGVGKIDGKLMLYFGQDCCLCTAIAAPPEGPRWSVAYRTLPPVAFGTFAIALLWRRYRGESALLR
jgi:hypothetical protein